MLFSVYSVLYHHRLFSYFVPTFSCFCSLISIKKIYRTHYPKHCKHVVTWNMLFCNKPPEALDAAHVWSVSRTHLETCWDASKTQETAEWTHWPWKSKQSAFLPLFLAGKLYHSLSVCSLHDKMGFDSPVPSVWSVGSRRRSEGPGVWQQWCCRAQGTSVSHRSQMWAEHFLLPTSAKHSPDLGTPTDTMHRAVCTVREEQEHFTALPVWPRFTLTAQDKAKALRLCCVASYAVVSVKMKIWFHYCVSCLSVLAGDNNFHKTASCKHVMFHWCSTKGYFLKSVSAQQDYQGLFQGSYPSFQFQLKKR